MKKIHYIFILSFFLLAFTNAHAQVNLVPNPSFEQDTACPNAISQIYKLKDWFTTNGTPDYFNRCYTGVSNNAKIPLNVFGYQDVGNSCHTYVGMHTMYSGTHGSSENIYNEILSVKLTDSLIKNAKYFLSFKTSLANNVKYSTNNIGILFSTKKPMTSFTCTPINFAQINFTQFVNDTLNWTILFKPFIADSNYKFISIGNFYDTLNTSEIIMNSTGFPTSYFYFDDVNLSTDSAFTYNFSHNCSPTLINNNSIDYQFKIFPNPFNSLINIECVEAINSTSIFNNLGQIVFYENQTDIKQLDLTSLQVGIYFLELKTRNQTIYKKITKTQ